MKESIKKRVEAFRRGEMPEGYVFQNHQLRPVDWEYEKISKYLVPYDEFSNDTEAYPLATSSRQGLMLQSEYYNNQRYEETSGGFHVVPEGYVTYRHMSDDDIFRFNVNRMGNSVLVSPEYPVFTTSDGLHLDMLVSYLNNMKEFKAYCSAQKKGSTRTRMYFSRLGEFAMPIPPVKEQQKIAEILATCDRMIELKQSKIDELNKLKQVCLLEMFPQKGQTIPKRRFPGFSAPWEQRKLGELIREISTGKSVNSDEGIVGADNIGVLKTSCVSYDHFDPSESKPVVKDERHLVKCAVEEDSVIVSRMNTPERVGACGYVERSFPNLFLPDRLWKLKFQENVNAYFLYTMLISGGYKEKITSMASGTSGSMYNIPKDAFLNLRLTLSLDIDEQKKIGDYFKQLDHLITLHQRELAEVGKYKKALMQLLLTGLVRVNA